MNPNRQFWNQQQQALRQALSRPQDHDKAIALFLSQHAMVHSAQMAQTGAWSFEDEVWENLSETAAHRIPRGAEHSVAWMLWHIARIEDVTMNILIAGGAQVFNSASWMERMNVSVCDTGNAMSAEAIASLSTSIDIPALCAYRQAVGRRTQAVVSQLQPREMKQKVDPARLQRMLTEGAVEEAAKGLLDYWGGLSIAGLLLMPPTRHNFVHLNEALRIK